MVKQSQNVIDFLRENNFTDKEIQLIEEFKSRDGFQKVSDDDFDKMMIFFKQYPDDFEDIVPIMTDDNSNYICVYYQSDEKGKVCYLSHDETDLSPKYNSIESLINSIENNPASSDFTELPEVSFDY